MGIFARPSPESACGRPFRDWGRQYQEWFGEFIGLGTDSHLTLLHCFKQSRLHLCRSAVDFVGKYEVCEYWTFLSHELSVFLTVNHSSHYVGRQKVGSELDATELCIDKR